MDNSTEDLRGPAAQTAASAATRSDRRRHRISLATLLVVVAAIGAEVRSGRSDQTMLRSDPELRITCLPGVAIDAARSVVDRPGLAHCLCLAEMLGRSASDSSGDFLRSRDFPNQRPRRERPIWRCLRHVLAGCLLRALLCCSTPVCSIFSR